jgi:lysophospholipase L1-like esterase
VIASALLLLLVTLVALIELGLRVALSPADYLSPDLHDDPHLGLVIKPHAQGHDAHGLRNPGVPAQAAIVAVGDSFTYGYNATRAHSWPAQLEKLTGQTVYNAGLGGFGPLQHLYITDTVVAKLKPKLEVVGLYLGNDLLDAYNLTKKSSEWSHWRSTPAEKGALTDNDREGQRLWEQSQEAKRFAGLREWLSTHCMTYAVLRSTVLGPLAAMWRHQTHAALPPEEAMPWSPVVHPATSTVFTSKVRAMALDTTLPEVAEGLRLTQRAITHLKASADRQGHAVVYALIPTKEHVYCATLTAANATLPDAHAAICRNEPQIVSALAETLVQLNIPVVDTTKALSDALGRGESIYLRTGDGHPNARGYRVIAQAIAEALPKAAPTR